MIEINSQTTDWYRCVKCKCSFFVDTADKNIHLLKPTMRCPNFRSCAGTIRYKAKWPQSGKIEKGRRISAIELYQASAGVGLPEEQRCSPNDMTKLMVGTRIKAVHLEKTSDPKKSVLMSMTLENGKVVHVTTSTRGALIYKVTEA